LAVVEYLQTAVSLVAREMIVCVVPKLRAPLGKPLLLTGGVVSGKVVSGGGVVSGGALSAQEPEQQFPLAQEPLMTEQLS